MALGWVLSSAPNETGTIDSYWDGDEWQTGANALSAAEFYNEESGVTVELMRSTEGDFQQRFTDRDVRMARAEQTLSLA